MKQVFLTSYIWSHSYGTVADKVYESGISKMSIIQWEQYYRDICADYFVRNKPVLGGPGMVVEVSNQVKNEALIFLCRLMRLALPKLNTIVADVCVTINGCLAALREDRDVRF